MNGVLTLNIAHGMWAARPWARPALLEVFAAMPKMRYCYNAYTWVVYGEKRKHWKKAVYRLSEACGEDCIAAYNHDSRKGRLIGPKAYDWGPFNIDLFTFISDVYDV